MFFHIVLLLSLLALCSAFSILPPKFVRQGGVRLDSYAECQPGEFDKLVTESNEPVIVDFYANWCGPCKLMGPIFQQVSEDYVSKVNFVKVDTDQHEETVERYSIQGLPLFAVFVKGQIVASFAGALTKDALKDFITKSLASQSISV